MPPHATPPQSSPHTPRSRSPTDIKFVIADFSSLFGSTIGAKLQQWCTRLGFPLAWSLGLNLGPMVGPRFESVGKIKGPLSTDAHARLLDPVVGVSVGVNVSVSSADQRTFGTSWSKAAAIRCLNASFNASDWEARWRTLRKQTDTVLHMAPLHAAACVDLERCIGIDAAANTCVCY